MLWSERLSHSLLTSPSSTIGLVLSGGGARGAYEVGVLRYVREALPVPTRFDVITGTSIGAINGSYVAATCDRPRAQMRALARIWQDIDLDEVYRFGWSQVRGLPHLLRGKAVPLARHGATLGGMVNPTAFEHVARNLIPWGGISANLAAGRLQALACTATELYHGHTTIFVQTRERDLPPWPRRSGQVVVRTAMAAEHAMASAAIPTLFPAVRIGDAMFVDGSLRQNTPIHPVLTLGAQRILVIGLRHRPITVHSIDYSLDPPVYPNVVFMLGKIFDALMLDKLEADIARIRRTNEVIRAGEAAFGPDFSAKLAANMPGRAGRPYEKVSITLIQPSTDIGELALSFIRDTGLRRYKGVAARFLRWLAEESEGPENDLASYLLFDREYARRLIELGYSDARAKHRELEALFSTEPSG